MTRTHSILNDEKAPWRDRLDFIMETMREMSLQTDPQAMVKAYVAKMEKLLPADKRISLSRRGLQAPQVKITRYSEWQEDVNPWKHPDRVR